MDTSLSLSHNEVAAVRGVIGRPSHDASGKLALMLIIDNKGTAAAREE